MKKVTVFAIAAFVMSSIGGYAQNQPQTPAPPQAQPQGQATDNTWSLRECIDYALVNSLRVRSSQLQANADRALAFQSKAAVLPTINASGNYAFNTGRTLDPTTQRFVDTTIQTSRLGLNGSLLLFQGGQQLRTIQQSQTTAKASHYDFEQARITASLNVAQNYLLVLNGRELVEAARLQVEVSRQQADRTERLVTAGSLAQTDLLTLKATLANDQLALTTAENNLRTAKLNLMQAMNLPAQPDFDVESIQLQEPTINAYDVTSQQIYETALETQFSVKSADLRVKSSHFAVQAARGFYYPSLALNAGLNSNFSNQSQRFQVTGETPTIDPADIVGYVGGNSRDLVLRRPIAQQPTVTTSRYPYFDQIGDNLTSFVALGLNIPILNGWQTRTQVSRAVILQKTTELDAQTVRVQLRQDIELAYNEMQAAASQYVSNKQQVESLDLAFKAAEARFNAGALNSTDYSIAKANLDRARANLILAKYSYYFRMKVLDFYQNKPLTF
ncbi:MAG: TolC family protein [Cytophagales bacterium]|nr:TolC family protein [Cytophagales bacterium]